MRFQPWSVPVIALIGAVPFRAPAQGGPPLITDDPDTPGPGYWEINVATTYQTSLLGWSLETPHLDLNYGVGRRIQLKYEVPWVTAQQTGEARQSDVGTSVAGVKWRFIGQEGTRIAWSIYPQFAFNTTHSSVAKGIADDGVQLLLPTEITLEMHLVELNIEVGRNLADRIPDSWVYGLTTEVEIPLHLELAAELHGEKVDGEPTELIANVGAREKLTGRMTLLVAAGRSLRSSRESGVRYDAYAGLQFNLPGRFVFLPMSRRQ